MLNFRNKNKELTLSTLKEQIRSNYCTVAENQINELATLNDDPEIAKQLTYASASLSEIKELINNGLSISDIKKGRFIINNTPVFVDNLLKNILMAATGRANEKGITLNLTINGIAQSASDSKQEAMWIKSDTRLLKTVFANLLSNAIKFTGKHGCIDVSITLTQEDDKVAMQACIKDTGIGMSPDSAKHLFQEFHQAHTNTSENDFGGTGLGLSFVKSITDLMNCKINVASELNKGTQFTLNWDNLSTPSEQEKKDFIENKEPNASSSVEVANNNTKENLEIICHDARNYFSNLIAVYTEINLIIKSKNTIKPNHPALNDMINHSNKAIASAENVLELFNNYLHLAKCKSKNKSETISVFNLNKLLADIQSSFALRAELNNNKLLIILPASKFDYTKADYELVKQILTNIIAHEIHCASEKNEIYPCFTMNDTPEGSSLSTHIKNKESDNLTFLNELCSINENIQLSFDENEIRVSIHTTIPTIEEINAIIKKSDEMSVKKNLSTSNKILLVDDNDIARKLMSKMISRLDYTCITAKDGLEAIKVFKEHKGDFALVLMDECMEPMGGFEATENLRRIEKEEDYKPCSIVGLSGNYGEEQLAKAKQSGMNDFVSKPLKIEKLITLAPKLEAKEKISKHKNGLFAKNKVAQMTLPDAPAPDFNYNTSPEQKEGPVAEPQFPAVEQQPNAIERDNKKDDDQHPGSCCTIQ
ncbi:MAG: ATP-binding protein [Gammaproteobacteria bacterium]|nr:ATP-binding protein [Gammaproteobacteria bacterium]